MFSDYTLSEVYTILELLGKEYINKLPSKLFEFIEKNRKKDCIININMDEDISNQDISEDASDFLTYLNLEYWCNEEEKQRLIEQLKNNDIEYEKELKEKYDVDKIFQKRKNNMINTETTEMVEYKENKNIFSKLFDFIKRLFKR